MKERLDVLLVKRNLAESREKAKAIIMSGNVFVEHGNVELLRKEVHLDADSIVEKIVATYDALK